MTKGKRKSPEADREMFCFGGYIYKKQTYLTQPLRYNNYLPYTIHPIAYTNLY